MSSSKSEKFQEHFSILGRNLLSAYSICNSFLRTGLDLVHYHILTVPYDSQYKEIMFSECRCLWTLSIVQNSKQLENTTFRILREGR
jgi:hypothetical protein